MTRRFVFFTILFVIVVGTGIFLFLPRDEEENGRSVNGQPTPTAIETQPGESPADEDPFPSPSPPEGVRNLVVWDGPDDAVATWFSESCRREVLSFGPQQYAPGGQRRSVPPEVEYLGYRDGDRQLWGDRGVTTTLYITTDGGRTLREWLAVEESC